MAIRTLLDHGIQQEHIIFVTFLVARIGGVSVLGRAFPRIKIICGAVDESLRETWLDHYDKEGLQLEKCAKVRGRRVQHMASFPSGDMHVTAQGLAWRPSCIRARPCRLAHAPIRCDR